MDHRPSVELLEANHLFPGVYRFKAIGRAENGFEERVLDAIRSEVAAPSEFEYTVRKTPGGRHVALTLKVMVQTAEQVREIYDRLQRLDGLTHLL